ncbi:MAG: hypothetical protein ACYCUV_11970 [Phycisphaerae bacterium]
MRFYKALQFAPDEIAQRASKINGFFRDSSEGLVENRQKSLYIMISYPELTLRKRKFRALGASSANLYRARRDRRQQADSTMQVSPASSHH